MKKNNQTKKPFFHNLFYNNKYLAFFSFITAFIIWIVVVMVFTPETTYKIEDVPVVIDLEDTTAQKLDLQAFTEKEYTVDVTVEGKRYSITQRDLSPDDITVTANISYVDSVGDHTLKLVANKNNRNADYEIVALSSEEIEVYFDAYKEIQVDLKVENLPEGIIPEGYYSDGAVLSSNSIVIGGAASQINRIDKENIYARINEDEIANHDTLTKTTHFSSEISLVDNYGNKVDYVEVKSSAPVVITVPVMKKAEFATEVEFTNTPDNYVDFISSVSITPETLNICATEDVISSLENVIVGAIDFSELKSGKNIFKFKKDDFSVNLKVFDDIEEVSVTVIIDDLETKRVNIDKSRISFTNVSDNCTVSFVDNESVISDVLLYGTADEIEKINSDSVYAIIDMSGYKGKTGRDEVKARISVNNSNCWAYGSYKLPINVVIN